MTFLFILCPVALLLVALINLMPVGTGAAEVQERMERRGSANRSSSAPVAPRVKGASGAGADDAATAEPARGRHAA